VGVSMFDTTTLVLISGSAPELVEGYTKL
jgi:hypothetical protein